MEKTPDLILFNQLIESGLSPDAATLLCQWQANKSHQPVCRPDWDYFFMHQATQIRLRSSDAQTAVGAIIVDKHNIPLGFGYNGFMADIDDEWLPNTRPDKYPWTLHAEKNAILNCEHRPRGAKIYVTCHPCIECYQMIVQAGITEVIYDANNVTKFISPEMMVQLEIAKWLTRRKVTTRGYIYDKDKKWQHSV